MNFTHELTHWYENHKRKLPWRETTDAYTIWISEIILQQTRVDQGIDYFRRFVEAFPRVSDLAAAEEQTVLKLWEGLGYYSRARNLHFSAKYVMNELNGVFPSTHKDILKLKGVGDYTASAVASISFGEYEPVVDGNVYRFFSRLFGIDTPINTTTAFKEFRTIGKSYISKAENPGDFNQALMEFGATVCTPKNAQCEACVFQADCVSYHTNLVYERPVKPKKIKVRDRYFYFIMPESSDYIYLQQRTEIKDVWRNLFQLPLYEAHEVLSGHDLEQVFNGSAVKIVNQTKHKLSHQHLHISFLQASKDCIENHFHNLQKVNYSEINDFPLPKPIKSFFENLRSQSHLDLFR